MRIPALGAGGGALASSLSLRESVALLLWFTRPA